MRSCLLALLAMGCFALAQQTPLTTVYHRDGRGTPQLEINPDQVSAKNLSHEQLAQAYLQQNAAHYQLPEDLENLQLFKVKESLLGKHYSYQQFLHGIPVENAEIIVSINKHGKIFQVFNNTYPLDANQPFEKARLNEDQAFDKAWQDLAVSGPLITAPEIDRLYMVSNGSARLIFRTLLNVAEPMGAWQHWLDASSGEILKVENTIVSRIPVAVGKATGPLLDRKTAFNAYFQKQAEQELIRSKNQEPVRRASGSGKTFDPDPRTTLDDESLRDNSPANSFTNAYFTRDLLDISLTGNTYSLTGPWVNITEIESPVTAPSTTTSGIWDFTRGNNGFNDSMTYFHLDQSQRYMQGLGFTGATGIQFLSIDVDTDGVNGDDNSHYSPSGNYLAFGHGCVDDNEDADVILHEYGHAIQRSINSSWSGGDTGAMGEGFGDYWAGSYSLGTKNGMIFHPEWVFTWDGHLHCWDGRLLNQTSFQYDPSRTYTAHATVGGVLGDELWSSPLISSLLEAMESGYSHEQVDQIVLQSHFGLGSGLTMRTLGAATVAAAEALYPNTNLGKIFTSHFVAQNILTTTFAFLKENGIDLVSGAGDNQAADPGETIGLEFPLVNDGNLDANSVSATLTSTTQGVSINSGSSNYPSIAVGASEVNLTPFQIQISGDHPCGEPVALHLALQYTNGSGTVSQIQLDFSLQTGVPDGAHETATPKMAIPDNQSNGISSQIVVQGLNRTVDSNFNLDVNITHSSRDNLDVSLTSPDGTTVKLHDNTGGTSDDLIGNYPNSLISVDSLDDFLGEHLDGTWTLTVADTVSGSTGTFVSWTLNDFDVYSCGICGVIDVTQDENLTICPNNGVMLEPNIEGGNGPFTYSWTPVDGLDDPSSATPVATPTGTTTYQVQITDDSGCSALASTTVYVYASTSELAPSWLADGTTEPGGDLDDDSLVTIKDFVLFTNSCSSP